MSGTGRSTDSSLAGSGAPAHPPPMEIAAGKSRELPRDIHMNIFSLLEITDLVRAGSVCSSWNSAYTSLLCNTGQHKQSQTPCLLYTSESAGESVACLYSLAEKRTYRLTLPEPPIHRRHLIGSSHGWLVTADEQSELHLVNPITCEQIALPSVTTIEQVKPVYDDGGAICKYHYSRHIAGSVATRQRTLTFAPDKLRCYLHHKALVFYDASAGSYFVVFIHNPFGRLAFARLGDEKWTKLSCLKHIQDCIYKDGLLYAVTAFGEIIAFNLSGTVVTSKIIMDSIHDIYVSARAYIVQAPWGDLLLVWRPEHWVSEDLDGQHEKATSENKVGRMIIYKICTEAKKKVQINSLDGHILFLGSNQSLCCNAEEYPQLKPDHVYFADDIDHKVFCTEQNYRLNVGVLDFKSKRVEEIIFPRPWSNCLAPLLIIPNPRKMDLHI